MSGTTVPNTSVGNVDTSNLDPTDASSITNLENAFKEAVTMGVDVLHVSTMGNAQLDAAKTRPQG